MDPDSMPPALPPGETDEERLRHLATALANADEGATPAMPGMPFGNSASRPDAFSGASARPSMPAMPVGPMQPAPDVGGSAPS